jgi:hypothetical protein
MTFTEQQVEWIVEEVIRRLGLLGNGVNKQSAPTGDLELKDRVVTMRSLDGQLSGVKRVVVSPRAVVTPAVLDELKQRDIALVRKNSQ